MPRTPLREPPWLTKDEQQTLISTVKADGKVRDMAIITLLLCTGLRLSELCELTWADVHLSADRGEIDVKGSETTKRGGRVTLPRRVPLNRVARQVLYDIGYDEHKGTSNPVLVGQMGPLTTRGVQIMFGKYARAAGLANIAPENLRHTFCKNLADAGADLRSLALLAGHLTYEAARQYYEAPPQALDHWVEASWDGIQP